MKNKFDQIITGLTIKSFQFLFFLVIISFSLKAQSPSNLERFYTAVDSATTLLISDLANTKEIKLDLTLGSFYSVFANPIRGKIIKSGIKILSDQASSENAVKVNFVIDNCNVEYNQPYRNGLFGDYFAERKISVSGNYFISSVAVLRDYNIALKDTIKIDDIEKLENRSYPFTHSELPPEPFFSSLLEPIVAVGAAAITIILFFSVRSK